MNVLVVVLRKERKEGGKGSRRHEGEGQDIYITLLSVLPWID